MKVTRPGYTIGKALRPSVVGCNVITQ